jgi:AcrR family transcriptional regulator
VRSWVPVPGSAKARLVEGALAAFGARGYAAVGVTELAGSAGVTIGSLYHHFGSKAGIYTAVREDVERRLLDRMEGAAATAVEVGPVLLVGFDYLVAEGFARLLAEPHPERPADPVEAFFRAIADRDGMPVGRILLAAWRAALLAASEAGSVGADTAPVRRALLTVISG